MITDPTQIEESIVSVVDYMWKDEMGDFEECFEVEIQSQDSLPEWIEWCEKSGNTSHIFYDLMRIKLAFPDFFNIIQKHTGD